MVLLNLVTDNTIQTFIYRLKPYMKGFVKAQVQAITDASLKWSHDSCDKARIKHVVWFLDSATLLTLPKLSTMRTTKQYAKLLVNSKYQYVKTSGRLNT